jgi:hypothetical protein
LRIHFQTRRIRNAASLPTKEKTTKPESDLFLWISLCEKNRTCIPAESLTVSSRHFSLREKFRVLDAVVVKLGA